MSKKAITALEEYGERNLFLRGIIPTIGMNHAVVEYEQKERFAGTSKYPFKKMLQFAVTGVTSLTDKPLLFVFSAGVFILFLSFAGLATLVGFKIAGKNISAELLFFASLWLGIGINLLAVGLVGIYIGKIYSEAKKRPRFFIQDFIHNS